MTSQVAGVISGASHHAVAAALTTTESVDLEQLAVAQSDCPSIVQLRNSSSLATNQLQLASSSCGVTSHLAYSSHWFLSFARRKFSLLYTPLPTQEPELPDNGCLQDLCGEAWPPMSAAGAENVQPARKPRSQHSKQLPSNRSPFQITASLKFIWTW